MSKTLLLLLFKEEKIRLSNNYSRCLNEQVSVRSTWFSFFLSLSLVSSTLTVTGGARGLGLVLAHALLEAGSHVYCLDILPSPASPASWSSLQAKAKTLGLTVGYKSVDVTKPELVDMVFDEIEKDAGEKVKVFVGAAGSKFPTCCSNFKH